MRYSVLHCIGQLAGTGTGNSVWRGMTDKLAEAIAVYLDSAQTSAVREAAAQVGSACVALVISAAPALVGLGISHTCHWPFLALWFEVLKKNI